MCIKIEESKANDTEPNNLLIQLAIIYQIYWKSNDYFSKFSTWFLNFNLNNFQLICKIENLFVTMICFITQNESKLKHTD